MRAAARPSALNVGRDSGTEVELAEVDDAKKVYELSGAKDEKVFTPVASPT